TPRDLSLVHRHRANGSPEGALLRGDHHGGGSAGRRPVQGSRVADPTAGRLLAPRLRASRRRRQLPRLTAAPADWRRARRRETSRYFAMWKVVTRDADAVPALIVSDTLSNLPPSTLGIVS